MGQNSGANKSNAFVKRKGDDLPTRVTKIRSDLTTAQISINDIRTELGQVKGILGALDQGCNESLNEENNVDVSHKTMVEIIESTYQFTPCIRHGGSNGTQPGAFRALPMADQLSFNIVHLETVTRRTNGGLERNIREVSTGFLVDCNIESEKRGTANKIVLVTTKHSIEVDDLENQHCVVKFHFFDKLSSEGKCILAKVQFPSMGYQVGSKEKIGWISPTNQSNDHDYIVLPISPLLEHIENQIASKYECDNRFYPLRHMLRLEGDLLSEVDYAIGYFSNVVMLGYPLMHSNSSFLPIARFGQCASNPHSFNRKDEHPTVRGDFLVDMSCCEGSSGSPVWFISREFEGRVKNTDIVVENNTYILEDDEVDVDEDTYYVFAGMMFESPDGPVKSHDVHLGCINSARTIGDFLVSLVRQERL